MQKFPGMFIALRNLDYPACWPAFLKGMKQNMDLLIGKNLLSATIGVPYQMYTIHPDVMKENVTITDDMITSAEEWRFPIICNGRIRALLTVAKANGQWQAVDIGAAALASEMDALEKNLSLTTRDINRIILRLYQINSDFIVITEGSAKITNGLFYPVKYRAPVSGEYKPLN